MKTIITLLILGIASQVLADNVCDDDVKEFCSGVLPVGGGIIRCLQSHRGNLYEDCQSKLDDSQRESKNASSHVKPIQTVK